MITGEEIVAFARLMESQPDPIDVRVVVEDPNQARMALGRVGKLTYAGFDPDIGDLIKVDEQLVAVHEIERIELVNSDYWRRQPRPEPTA